MTDPDDDTTYYSWVLDKSYPSAWYPSVDYVNGSVDYSDVALAATVTTEEAETFRTVDHTLILKGQTPAGGRDYHVNFSNTETSLVISGLARSDEDPDSGTTSLCPGSTVAHNGASTSLQMPLTCLPDLPPQIGVRFYARDDDGGFCCRDRWHDFMPDVGALPVQRGTTAAPSPSPSASPDISSSPTPSPAGSPAVAPSLSVFPSTISAGQVTTVTYRGTPGTLLDILSRTQPAMQFSRIGTALLDSNGNGYSTHKPQKNTRITARTDAGELSAYAPLVEVRSVASFNANRVGIRTYTFTGRVYPALTNRLVNIYRNGNLVAQARCDATGIYKITRTLGAGTFTFQARTPNDQYNLGTNSQARNVRIY